MNKLKLPLAVLAVSAMTSQAHAQDYDAQIDALQNELLKIKQDMSGGKDKAYFNKGKGLRVKSSDGKYSFQIKGRLMYDIAGLADYETASGNVAQDNGFGSEFRRLRFTLKGDIGDGWGFAFQPDFADGSDDASDRTVVFKDALIYKKIKGFGTITVGNQKAAAGLYENTSSNNLIFMERPMHNEMFNLGHRTGIGYDTKGAFGKQFHLKATFFSGLESAIEQNLSDGQDGNESYGFSTAGHFNIKSKNFFGGKMSTILGIHYAHYDVSNLNGTLDTNSARAQGIHTLIDKPIDLGNLSNLDSYNFWGPQISFIWNQLLIQTEYQEGWYEFTKASGSGTAYQKADDFDMRGGSISAAYAFSGKLKHSGKKGALSGLKCKKHCTMVKYQYEFIDAIDDPADSGSAQYSANAGGTGEAHTFGINHYFKSDVRLMLEYSDGDYGRDNSQSGASSEMQAFQARLHLKY